jgi:teichuronic acid biosynthesis glycosyltransferase TuaG
MTKSPLVTIMMPVYNGEKTIELAIRSLFLQTYENWICIIVDDGSTDGTFSLLKKYDSDKKFKIIRLQKNSGRAVSRQIALNNAVGQYLGYLDADDFYHPKKLERQIEYLERNPEIHLISCGQGSFDNDFKLISVRGLGAVNKSLYKPNKSFRGSYAGSLLRLSEAKKISYNLKLKSSEDDYYIKKYLNHKSYSVLNEVLYYNSEIGFTSSKKILAYQIEAFKNEFGLSGKTIQASFISIIRLCKILIYIVGLPVLGADYFLKLRGITPGNHEFIEFEKTLQSLYPIMKVNNL